MRDLRTDGCVGQRAVWAGTIVRALAVGLVCVLRGAPGAEAVDFTPAPASTGSLWRGSAVCPGNIVIPRDVGR